jgi:hypothetical protein
LINDGSRHTAAERRDDEDDENEVNLIFLCIHKFKVLLWQIRSEEHLLLPLSELLQYVELKNTNKRAKRRCRVDGCQAKIGYYCDTCTSDIENDLHVYCVCSPTCSSDIIRRSCYLEHLKHRWINNYILLN